MAKLPRDYMQRLIARFNRLCAWPDCTQPTLKVSILCPHHWKIVPEQLNEEYERALSVSLDDGKETIHDLVDAAVEVIIWVYNYRHQTYLRLQREEKE